MELLDIKKRENLLNKELNRIVEIIINKYGPEKIILFGSLVGPSLNEGSDIDLLIIKDTSKRFVDRCVELAQLTHPKVGIDFFVYTPIEYKNMLKEKFTFMTDITRTGKVLYEKRDRRMA